MLRTHIARFLLTLLMFSWLAGCSTVVSLWGGGQREATISVARLQESVDKRFPITHRVMEMFDIKLTRPQIVMQPDENRLGLVFDLVVAPPLTSKTWRGSFKLSGGLRIDAASNTIYLREPKLDEFIVDAGDPVYKRQITKIGSLLFERVMQDAPIYTFTPEQTRQWGVDYSLVKINTRADGLVLSFEPTKK
jgi:hypothetical protein